MTKMTVCIVTQFETKVPHGKNDSMHSYVVFTQVPQDKNDSMHSYVVFTHVSHDKNDSMHSYAVCRQSST